MRIIAGKYGRRLFKSPPGHRTHPMGERIRTALFNSLGSLEGEEVLDAFAGSGALGFESISRGAARVTLIETDPRAFRTVKENIEALNLETDSYRAVRANVATWLDNNQDTYFDLILADPPFTNLAPHIILRLAKHLKNDGRLVVNWPSDEEPMELPYLMITKQKAYAGAQLVYYEHVSNHAKATA